MTEASPDVGSSFAAARPQELLAGKRMVLVAFELDYLTNATKTPEPWSRRSEGGESLRFAAGSSSSFQKWWFS